MDTDLIGMRIYNAQNLKHFQAKQGETLYCYSWPTLHGIKVTTTFTKTAALAMAKQLADNPKNSIKHIEDTDESIQNKYNECIFYKYTMTTTDDDIKREVTKIRYDIVWEDLLKLRDTLDNYIFDK